MTCASQGITLKGSAELVAEFFCKYLSVCVVLFERTVCGRQDVAGLLMRYFVWFCFLKGRDKDKPAKNTFTLHFSRDYRCTLSVLCACVILCGLKRRSIPNNYEAVVTSWRWNLWFLLIPEEKICSWLYDWCRVYLPKMHHNLMEQLLFRRTLPFNFAFIAITGDSWSHFT